MRLRLGSHADVFAIGSAAALPWSATLLSIFIVLWLIALVPTVTWSDVRREVATPVGGLPVLLCVLGLVGICLAQDGWPSRLAEFSTFTKLLLIPIFLVQFQRSERGVFVLAAYLASCTLLMVVSWILSPWPAVAITANHSPHFAISILALVFVAIALFRRGERRLAAGALTLAAAFLGNIVFVVVPHLWLPLMLPLLVIPLGIGILLLKEPGHRAWCVLLVAAVTACGVLWTASHPLIYDDWLGDRVALWQRSLRLIAEAPALGHGVGSVPRLIAQAVIEQGGVLAHAATNPRQQTLAVGIQLGLAGVIALWAMWIAHLLFFRGNALCEWAGFVIVTQSIVGSMFDSQLSGAWGGWIYVIGVGVAGGMVRRLRAKGQSGDPYHLVL